MFEKLVNKLYNNRKHDPIRREFLTKCGLYLGSLAFPLVFSRDTNAGEIYKWKDKNGIWHFSDRYPTKQTDNVQTLNTYISPDNSSKNHKKKNSNLGKVSKKYNTTMHKGFDIESKIHDVRSDYRTLDNIINEVREEIKVKPNFSRNEAIQILKIINKTITKRHNFSSYTLDEPNCTNAHIYHAVGEALNLPIDTLNAPGHVFIRFNLDNGGYINWETSAKGEIFRNSDYIKAFNIAQTSINKGIYLSPRNKNQILANFYNQIVFELFRKKQVKKAIEYSKIGVKLSPESPELLNKLGVGFLRLGKNDKSILYFNESIRLNPNFANSYHNRGTAWKIKGDLNKAEEDFRKAERLEKELTQSLRGYQ